MPILPNTVITLEPPTLGTGYCPANYQTLVNDIVDGIVPTFNSDIGNSFFNTGAGTPSAANQIFPWLDSDGFWWVYSSSAWNRKHTLPAGSSERRMWVGTLTDLRSYDGGDGTATAPAAPGTGAMWAEDTAMSARFPVGAGAFAASGTVDAAGTQTGTGVLGEDKHLLIASEIPTHNHNVRVETAGGAAVSNLMCLDFKEKPAGNGNNDFSFQAGIHVVSDNFGGGLSHNNLPPFYGVYFIKRTARTHYTK